MIRVFLDEAHAARWWLEHRAPRRASVYHPEVVAALFSSSTNPTDVGALCRAIERGLDGIPTEWHGALLVHVGWQAGPKRIARYLWRAGLPVVVPRGLSRETLATRREQFRRRLAALGVIDAGVVASWDAIETGRERSVAMEEKPLATWKAIAEFLGCSVSTAQRQAEEGMPVYPQRGGIVRAYRSELNEWIRRGERASGSEAACP